MRTAYERNNTIIIAGDFNYKAAYRGNEYAPPSKEYQAIFINALYDFFLYHHMTEPTRFRSNENPNLLDLILSSEESMIQNLEYIQTLRESGYICLRFKVMSGIKETVKEESSERSFYKTDSAAVIKELANYIWALVLSSSFADDYKRFLEEIMA